MTGEQLFWLGVWAIVGLVIIICKLFDTWANRKLYESRARIAEAGQNPFFGDDTVQYPEIEYPSAVLYDDPNHPIWSTWYKVYPQYQGEKPKDTEAK